MTSRAWRLVAPVLLLLCATPPAHAIVNAEDLRVQKPVPGFSGNFAAAIAGQTGNTEKSAVSLGSRLTWYEKPDTNFIVFNYDYGKTGGVRDTNKGFLHARHVHDITDRRAWEAFAQAQKDEFTRLTYRGLLGGGARLVAYRAADDSLALITGIGAFYSREKLDDRAGTTDAGIDTLVRGNFYFVVKYRLNDTVALGSTTYYQPATSDFGDFRALEQAALHVGLTDRLDLKISLDIAYDSRPPQLVDKTDVTYRTGIEYRF
jgi:putative salt-induced outer membrane protein YdiY